VFRREGFILRSMQGESKDNQAGRDATDESGESGHVVVEAAESSAVGDPGDPLARAQAEAGRLKDAWLRAVADFDNFRKRTRREIDEARRSAREDLLRALLPVFDNLERALQSAQRSTDIKAMADGLSMVQRQFAEALGREAIARVPTLGKPFDPSVHEAIQQVETDEHPPGTIIAEVQPGYTQGERLVRAAMVVVARPKTGPTSDGATSPVEPAN
jgi:molecular chaperone GrpE